MLPANSNNNFLFQSVFEALEDRVLFDGVPDAAVVLPQADNAEQVPAQVQSLQSADADMPRQLVLVDAGVENADQLLAEILDNNPDSALEIRLLDADSDGVEQITDLLAASEGRYDAIHIISHGSDGEVALGNTNLSSENLDQYVDQLASWADSLTGDADLLFYGCDLAGSETGEQFIASIAAVTGADVAASDDLTGSAALGGDWELEQSVGTIETAAFSATAFDGVLIDTDGDGVDDADDIDDDNDGILDDIEFAFTTDTPFIDYDFTDSGSPVLADSGVPVLFSFTDPATGESIGATITANDQMPGSQADGFNPTGLVIRAGGLGVGDNVDNGEILPREQGFDELQIDETLTFAFDRPVVISGANFAGFAAVDDQQLWTINRSDGSSSSFIVGGGSNSIELDEFQLDPGDTLVIQGQRAINESAPGFLNGAPRADGLVVGFALAVLADTDGAGVSNQVDLDSDNDGISDLFESGTSAANIAADTNGDGTISVAEAEAVLGVGNADADGDGLLDIFDADITDASGAASVGTVPVDNDSDGIDDFLDLDSDNDGIADTIEARPTAGFVANDGDVTDNDADGDGVIDIFDANDGSTGDFGGTQANFNAPVDTDLDGTPDFLDDDSDADGMLDINESGLTLAGVDNNNDGIDDGVAPDSYADPDGVVTTTSADLANEFGDTSEVGFREVSATLGAAKEVAVAPVQQADGTFALTYDVVIANTGNLDLSNLSVIENLAAQFGPAFVSAANLSILVAPSDPASNVAINAAFDGDADVELIDTASPTLLAVGDSLTLRFDVVINPTTAALENQVVFEGIAVDDLGNPILDGMGNPVVVTDLSDSGADPDGDNPDAIGDTGGSDDATPLALPDIGLAKSAGDAVANGDNFDVTFTLVFENNGNVALNDLEIFDDVASQFGAQFVGIVPGSVAVQNFAGSGTAPTVNAAFQGDTTLSLISGGTAEVGDSFEVVFTVTIDPDATGTSNTTTTNSATSTGQAIDANGDPILDGNGDPFIATDVSDNGTNPIGENGADENNDGLLDNDPTPFVIADVSVAKQVVGSPVLQPNGDFEVTYQLVVENTGNVDLADLALSDDLATQFGTAFVSAGSLTLVTAPSDSGSSIVLDAAFDGSTVTQTIDQTASNSLAVGDFFIIEFTTIVDPDAAGAPGQIDNQATASGNAVDENGDPILDSGGNAIVTTDLSDTGSDPNGSNPADPSDGGTADDPTPLLIPAVGVAKSAGDAVANGDNFDITFTLVYQNTGTVDLTTLSLVDDVAAQFGNAFVGIVPSSLAVQNFAGTGTAPGVNAAFEGNTAVDLLDGSGRLNVGDSFEVVFTATIDPDGIDSVSQGLGNQATAGGVGINPVSGAVDPALVASDDSDNGIDPSAENGEDDGDGTFGNDVTPIVIADIAVAKQVVGDPIALADGNFEIVYQLVVENNGTVDVANLSLLEDLESQFGPAFISTSNLTLVSGPADANSSVALNSATFNGDTDAELINGAVPSLLVVGDSFVVQFTTVVDPDAGGTSSALNNSVTASGSAVDANGDPILDSLGNPIVATDDSDSGSDPSATNAGEEGDTGGSDDPTPLNLPAIGLAKSAGDAVANGDNFDVTFTFVYENTGTTRLENLSVLDDIAAQFGNAFVSAGTPVVQNFVGTGTAPTGNAAFAGDTSVSLISGGGVNAGDSFEVVFTVTIDPDGIDSVSQGLENSGTASGDAVDAMGNPLIDSAGNPLTATDTSDNGTDPNGENGADENGDGTLANDPTPIVIADVSVAKEVVGTPTLLANDNFSVTYQLVVENTGTVDLAGFSLADDLGSQFGAAFVNAGSITLISPPANGSIAINTAFDGDGVTELLNPSVNNTLAVADSFIVQFTVEVDPDASGTSGPLNNTATATGDAVDANGDPILDSAGNPVTTTDNSDSGSDPSGTNAGADGDTGGSDDPTPLLVPAVGVAKQANTVVVATDGAGNEIIGSFDIEYLFVIENTGTVELTNLQLTDDLTVLSQFGDAFDPSVLSSPTDRSGLVVGPAIVSNTLANPADLPTLNAGFLGGAGQTGIFDGTSGALQVGEQIVVSVTVRVDTLELTDGDPGDATVVPPSNQVAGSADSAVGSATDLSDDGLNPNNDNGDGGTNDPTPLEVPQVRLFKEQGDAISNGDGTSTITVTLRVANTGTVDLTNLGLTEDLADQFGAAFISTTAPVIDAALAPGSNIPAGLINGAWQSDTSQNLFNAAVTTESLAAGEEFTITFDVTVDPDLADEDSEFLTNSANVTADGQNFDGSIIMVSDDSGADNGDGIDVDEPTSAIVPEVAVAKSAGDAVANGDNFDVPFTLVVENTGSIILDSLTLFDDVLAQFGNSFVGVSGPAVVNFVGSGTAPTANAAWTTDTSQSLISGGSINPGDRFEVTFNVTIDPDGIDNQSNPLSNQAIASGRAVDQLGNPLTDSGGDPLLASDVSDSGSNPQGTNAGENGDTGLDNDPTPIIIADTGVAKSVVGSPALLANGNFAVTYQLVFENTGTTNLSQLSLVDDLATQFGPAFVGVTGVSLATPPTAANSSVTIDSAFDGTATSDIVDQSVTTNLLEIGDSFVVEFVVEIDAAAATGNLDNTATAGATAVDANGIPFTDAAGNPILASDDSDSGTDPNGDNPGQPGDDGLGGTDNPTPLNIPAIGLAKAAGDAVANGENFDVTFTLTFENTGTVDLSNPTLFDDVTSQFGSQFVGVSGLAVQNFVGTGTAPIANAAFEGDTTLSLISGGTVNIDDTFEVVFTVTIDPDATGVAGGLNNTATAAADALDENGNPLTDADGNPITANDTSDNGTDTVGENGEDNGDGTFGNDPTPIVIADIAAAKSVSGVPTQLDNGNFAVVYELVIENTGTVDLADLTLLEDLASQFGSAFVSAGSVTLVTPPANAISNVVLSAGFDGSSVTELVDQTASTALAVGDSFVVQFTVEVDVDAVAAPSPLDNQVVAGGSAVDSAGNPITDAAGNPIVATDDSDSGSDPNGGNPADQGDDGAGATDDPTPLLIPDVGIAKAASDAVANGDNFDVTFTIVYQNTGTVAVDSLTLIDDVAAQFGNGFVSASGLTVANFVGTGTAPAANAAWTGDTSVNLLTGGTLDVGDSFEVTFTVTIDPDGVDDLSQALSNQATGSAAGINPDGTPLTDAAGNPILGTDDSDNGIDPQNDNGDDANNDGIVGNDPTPIVIADLGIAKAVTGSPVSLGNGNFEVTYQVVVENNGTVDLANLSLIEDLATQYGPVYIDAGSLTLVTPPADPASIVTLNSANFDGSAVTEIIDTTGGSLLAIGDSFVIEFTVTVDPSQTVNVVTNSITGGGTAVDADGSVLTDAGGNPITATDLSDSGNSPNNTNPGTPGDTGGSDDPTPLFIPSVGLAKSAGDAVPNGDNFDITFTFAFENNGTTDLINLTLFDDIAAQFGNAFVSASNLAVQNFVGTGTAPTANAAFLNDTTQSLITGGAADLNDTFEVVFTVTIDPDGIDGTAQPLENSGTGGGDALDENGNPLVDSNGDPITASDVSDNGTDPDGDNGDETTPDGTFANDPTPIVIADLGIAKAVVGTTALDNGNFEVIYEVIVENTGTVDLANLSLAEDLATQFGPTLVGAGSLTLVTPPASASSTVAVDTAFDGSTATEIVSGSAASLLAVGDSFVVQFTVEVDLDANGTSGPLTNSVVGTGDAVDADGNPITDSLGNPIAATDLSDGGTDANGDNPDDQSDAGTSDDPTLLLIPDVGVAKLAGDPVANGENFDVTFTLVLENTGTVSLDNLTLTDDVRSQFGNAFVSASGLTISNFVGTGTAPTANAAWIGDSAQNLLSGGTLDVGDFVEVTFTVTIDPDGIDGTAQALNNSAVGSGSGVNPDGSPLTDADGNPVIGTDVSDDGTDPNDPGNDPSPILIADLGIAKQVFGTPVAVGENFEVTYRVVVENTGTVDLANLSLLEDLGTQYGSALVNVSSISVVNPPVSLASAFDVNGAFDGTADTELAAAGSSLAIGDSVTLEFTVVVDLVADGAPVPLENQIVGSGDAVDANGNPITDSNGLPVTASDDSDSGTDASNTNPGDQGDTGTAADPTPLLIADVGVGKTAGDAVANGDNFDVTFTLVYQNTGTVTLDSLSLIDDVAAQFGDSFVAASGLTVANFVGTGTAPTVNSDWLNNTSANLLVGGTVDPGDQFEITFTVTIDPDASGASFGLSNQAVGSGAGVNPDGTRLTDANGNPLIASDNSDSGTSAIGDNGQGGSDDPTSIVIADLGIAKAIVGEPELLFNGNSVVTFEVIVENTGTVDLASLSLIEDLAAQFGPAFVSVDNLRLVVAPTGPVSDIAINGQFDGSAVDQLLDQNVNNVLAIGDSFTIQFTVEVDPEGTTGPLNNQVVGTGDAVDVNGNALLDANGIPIFGSDLSDSGSNTNNTNPGNPGDTGTTDDPTEFTPAVRGLSSIAGSVFVDGNGNGLRDAGEDGIEGVEITLVGVDVFGNAVELTTLTDANGDYIFEGLNAGTYQVLQTQPGGFNDGLDSSAVASVGNDVLSDIVLGFNQSFFNNNFGEVLSGTSGNPAQLPPFLPFNGQLLSNRISSFLGGPGPIYSGVPISSNGNPLALDSGRPVTGGYSSEFATPDEGLDCGCSEVVEVVDVCDPCNAPVDQPEVVTEQPYVEEVVEDSECQSCQEYVPCEQCNECNNCCDCDCGPAKKGFLFRFKNWLNR